MSKSNQDILFNKRELKRLQKQGYVYITFDVSVTAWVKKPYFVSSENYKRNREENIKNGLWICCRPSAGINKISGISGIEDPQIHLYSIEKLLEIVPNSEQI
jgi:hypothetical protein